MREGPDERKNTQRSAGDDEKSAMPRRAVLGGLAASAVALLAPAGAVASPRASARERGPVLSDNEKHLQNMILRARARMRAEDVRAAFEGRGTNIMGRVARAIDLGLVGSHLDGTSFDTKELHRRYPVQIVFEPKRVIPALGKERRAFNSGANGGYANGFYFEDLQRVVTSKHALHMLHGEKAYLEPGGRDIGVVQVGKDAAALSEQVIYDDPTLNNAHIEGAFVVTVGIDPDDTDDRATGHKTFPAIAKKMTPAMVAHQFGRESKEWQELGARCFVMVLPPGESDKDAMGMSGSPVFIRRGDRYTLAGIFVATSTVTDVDGITKDVAFFLGIDDIREELKSPQTFTLF